MACASVRRDPMDHTASTDRANEWAQLVGRELFKSDWLTLDSSLLKQYQESCLLDAGNIPPLPPNPLGEALVDGTYMLSLVLHFKHNLMQLDTSGFYGLNYGYNKVRFLTQVAVGERVRLRGTLKSVDVDGAGRILLTTANTMDLEGKDKPAMFVEALSMYVPQS